MLNLKVMQKAIGLCPFHNEKSPSFMVNEKKQIFKCFGCGEGGDAIAFIMKKENLDFMDALKVLMKKPIYLGQKIKPLLCSKGRLQS